MHEYDKCGKYMVRQHGNAILWMGGVEDVGAWRAVQAEPVQVRQLPDGLLEVECPGLAQPDIFILEIASHPDARVPSQAVRDTAIIYLQRGIVPEVIVLFLHEKGNVPAADSIELQSRRGLTTWKLTWKAVKLWEVPAEKLLAMGDVGLIPWVPLARFDGSPETIVRRCQARIARAGPPITPVDQENLLAVTQFLLPLRYNKDPLLGQLRALLGGREAMIHSPLYQEVVEEAERKGETKAKREWILKVLQTRFGETAKDLKVELDAVEYDRLEGLLDRSLSCRTLASFRRHLLGGSSGGDRR
jgi:hypothetical protein